MSKEKETEWTKNVLKPLLERDFPNYSIDCAKALLYNVNVKTYKKVDGKSQAAFYSTVATRGQGSYETDLLISQNISEDEYLPLLVVESKLEMMTSHDIMTYNEKAGDHKRLHKNLMYGVVIANCKNGGMTLQKLFSHSGENFDFVFCFKGTMPTQEEWNKFYQLIKEKLQYSQKLYKLFSSSRKSRENFMCMDRHITID